MTDFAVVLTSTVGVALLALFVFGLCVATYASRTQRDETFGLGEAVFLVALAVGMVSGIELALLRATRGERPTVNTMAPATATPTATVIPTAACRWAFKPWRGPTPVGGRCS